MDSTLVRKNEAKDVGALLEREVPIYPISAGVQGAVIRSAGVYMGYLPSFKPAYHMVNDISGQRQAIASK